MSRKQLTPEQLEKKREYARAYRTNKKLVLVDSEPLKEIDMGIKVYHKIGEITGQPLYSVDRETWFSTEEIARDVYSRKCRAFGG